MTKDCLDAPFPSRVGACLILMRSRVHPLSHFPVLTRTSALHQKCSRNERLSASSIASRTCVPPNDGRSRDCPCKILPTLGSMIIPLTTSPSVKVRSDCSTEKNQKLCRHITLHCFYARKRSF